MLWGRTVGLVGLPGRVGHIDYRVQWVAVVVEHSAPRSLA